MFLERELEGNENSLVAHDDARDAVLGSLKIHISYNRTFLIAVAIGSDEENKMMSICCDAGTPLGGYVYHAGDGEYYARCADFKQIGYLSFSLELTMPDQYLWKIHLPVPELLIEKSLLPIQQARMKNFKNDNPDKVIKFLQLVD